MTAAYEILPEYVQDSEEWHDARREGIGASEVAAIMGLSKWQTPLSVYGTKMGRPHSISENLAYWGHKLEDAVAGWVGDMHPEVGALSPGIAARSVKWPWLTASPDRMAPRDVPVELKTSSAFSKSDWADGIPVYYLVQVQTQIAVLDAPHGWLAVLHGGSDAELYKVNRDDVLIDQIVTETRAFWEDHVLKGILPLPSNTDEAVDLWPGDPAAGAAEGTHVEYEAWLELTERLDTVAQESKRIEELKLRLQVAMKDAPLLVYGDMPLATWKPRKGSTRFDTTAFKKDHPELAQEYLRTGEATRVFQPVKEKTK